MARRVRTVSEKLAFNDGVRAAVKELMKYDGVITDEGIRKYVAQTVYDRVKYKRIKRYEWDNKGMRTGRQELLP